MCKVPIKEFHRHMGEAMLCCPNKFHGGAQPPQDASPVEMWMREAVKYILYDTGVYADSSERYEALARHIADCAPWGKGRAVPKATLPVGVSVLMTRGGQVLLGKRKNNTATGLYSTPGGRLEQAEDMLQCAIREAKEETGVTLGSVRIINFREHFRYGNHYVMFYAHATEWEGSIVNTEPDKCEGWEWFDLDNVPDNCTEPAEILELLSGSTLSPDPPQKQNDMTEQWIQPTYYVQHPDNAYSVADPQPRLIPEPPSPDSPPQIVSAPDLAQKFHEAYERLAPQFGYETRKESAKPWGEVPENNRQLMTAVCREVMRGAADLLDKASAEIHMLERAAESHKYTVSDLVAERDGLREALRKSQAYIEKASDISAGVPGKTKLGRAHAYIADAERIVRKALGI